MSRRIFKWFGMIIGGMLLAVLILFAVILLGWGRNKDQLIKQAISSDGKLVAEIHQIITPMHGGPDILQVTIRSAKYSSGDVVYSQTYECDTFRLQWKNPNELTVVYGACDSGRWHTKDENKVWQRNLEWRDVTIDYQDSGDVVHE
jgi:hypothetical protein